MNTADYFQLFSALGPEVIIVLTALLVLAADLLGAPRVELAHVGPFDVEVRSRGPLRITLAIAFVVIAGLALTLAWRASRTG